MINQNLRTMSSQPESTDERSQQTAEQAGRADAGVQPLSFAEPWKLDEGGDVVTIDGHVVVDAFGSTIDLDKENAYMRRIVACINVCQGVSTEDLERCNGLIAKVVTA